MKISAVPMAIVAAAALQSADGASAQEADLATKLANPLAALISVPIQGNYDQDYGPGSGERYVVNVQPVVPFALNDGWNLISRTILPVTGVHDIVPTEVPGPSGDFGLGNTTQSLFFSPSRTVNGITWGVGPVLYLPTNTGELLGPDKWAAGPTAVALWQGSGWTAGLLANQLWSFAGSSSAPDINSTYLQPFISYTTKDAWTFTLNAESTYDWNSDQWSVPVNFQVAKLTRFGKLPVSLFGGVRYWVESPSGSGPEDWGVRLGMTFLFPKG